jgi:DNA helicase II / ATP-dependent DNA helicase PcrA
LYKKLCDQRGISYLLRTDEKTLQGVDASFNQITLSTVHAIKGLEAEFVFVVGVNFKNYPCKAKDHQYVDLLASKNDYDSFEEERRLFYVACTRAKKELFVSYSSHPSPFLSTTVLGKATNVYETKPCLKNDSLDQSYGEAQRSALRRWRYLEAEDRGLAPYMIFSDRALESLLAVQPLDVNELLQVNGLGKAKVTEFGEDILRVLHGL